MDAQNTNTVSTETKVESLKELISLCRQHDLFGDDLIGHLLGEIKSFDRIDEEEILQRVISDGLFTTFAADNLLYCQVEPNEAHYYSDIVKYLIDACNEITENDFNESEPTNPYLLSQMIQLFLTAMGFDSDSKKSLVSLTAAIIRKAITYGNLADFDFDVFEELIAENRTNSDEYEVNDFLITLSLARLLYLEPETVKSALEEDIRDNAAYMAQTTYFCEAYNIMMLIDACLECNG